MKQIMLSIKPKWVAKILNGEKTIELRKRFPLNYRGWVYLYCTKGKEKLMRWYNGKFNTNYGGDIWNCKVVARFWCDNVEKIDGNVGHPKIYVNACIDDKEACEYANGKPLFAIHISQLEIFDKPKEISDFELWHSMEDDWEGKRVVWTLYKAPQSWCYCEEKE